MPGIIANILALILVASPATGQAAQPATPEQQYKSLVRQYDAAADEYGKTFRQAKLPADRQKAIEEKYPWPGPWSGKVLELVEKNSRAPFVEDALVWIITNEARLNRSLPWHKHTDRYEQIWIIQARQRLPGGKQNQEVRGKAIDLLLRDHVTSARLSSAVQMLDTTREPKSLALLRAILEKNPNDEVRAEACLALLRDTQGRIDLGRQIKENPQIVKSAEPYYGKEYLEAVQQADVTRLESEYERLYADLTGKYISVMDRARVVDLCQVLRYTTGSESLLRFLYEKDRRRDVRGAACLILAGALAGKANGLAATDAEGAEKIRKESENLLEEAIEKYADVKLPFDGTVGAHARGELFDSRYLAEGKPAPEIAGLDQDGKRFKLSDYKGKVVLLDFWSEF